MPSPLTFWGRRKAHERGRIDGTLALRCVACKHRVESHTPAHPDGPPGCQVLENAEGFDARRIYNNNGPTPREPGEWVPLEDVTEEYLERCGCLALEGVPA